MVSLILCAIYTPVYPLIWPGKNVTEVCCRKPATKLFEAIWVMILGEQNNKQVMADREKPVT